MMEFVNLGENINKVNKFKTCTDMFNIYKGGKSKHS